MIDLDDAIAALRLDILKLAQLDRDRMDLLNTPLPPAMKEERDQEIKDDIEKLRLRLARILMDFAEFPPQHLRHKQFLAKFHNVAKFDKSVFVM
jgi:hypothetical protein